MTRLNLPLPEMHQEFSTKKRLLALFCLAVWLAGSFSGCKKKENLTLGEWIQMVNLEAGITTYQKKEPWFPEITKASQYYEDTQAAVEWGILEAGIPYDPAIVLNREWVAATLMNLADQEKTSNTIIRDLNETQFQKQVEAAVACNVMDLDSQNYFHPKKEIEKSEAEKDLAMVIDLINNRNIKENKTDITWQKDVHSEIVEPLSFDLAGTSITIAREQAADLKTGDVISYTDPNGFTVMRTISQCNDRENDAVLTLEEPDLLNLTDSIELSGESVINFDEAEIIAGESIQQMPAVTAFKAENHLQHLSIKAKQKTFQVGGFQCKLTQNGTTLSAELFQTLPHGTKVYALAKTSGVKTAYRFQSEKASIKDAYFKINCNTEESFGITNGSYKNLYGDFSKLEPQSFLQTISGLFQEKKDVLEETITVCTIRVPIPSAPLVSLKMAVEVHLNVSGKAEIVFTQKNVVGTEYKNGNIRFIKDTATNHQNKIKASIQATTGMRFALECALVEVMDASVNAGAKAVVKTGIHLYPQDGSHTKTDSSVSADVADELAEGNPDVLVCADMNAYLILTLKVNSTKTLLGKIGLSGSYEILGEKNASLFGSGSHHFENWHQVTKCTRNDRLQNTKKESLEVKDQIGISTYSLLVEAGSTKAITITALPEGYHRNDLVFQSQDPNVAEVSASGSVKALNPGSTIITISSKDGIYSIQCHVLVPAN